MNTRTSIALMLALTAACLVSAPLRAEAPRPSEVGVMGDTEFMRKASESGLAEVKTSLMAQDQAVDARVRALAQMLAADHGRNFDQLYTLAKSKSVDLPTTLDGAYQSRLDDLKNKKGSDFDKAYVDAVRNDQEALLGIFQTESRTGNDPEVRKYATDTLPILEAHVDRARALQR